MTVHQRVTRPGLKDSEKCVLHMQTQPNKECYPSDIVGMFPALLARGAGVSRKDRTNLESLCLGAKGWGHAVY